MNNFSFYTEKCIGWGRKKIETTEWCLCLTPEMSSDNLCHVAYNAQGTMCYSWFTFSCFKCMHFRPLLQSLTGQNWAESSWDHHNNLCFTDTSSTLLDAVLMITEEARQVIALQEQEMGKIFYEERDTC